MNFGRNTNAGRCDIRRKCLQKFPYHESVHRINHGVTVREVASSKQLGRTDGIRIGAHAAKQHHSLELQKPGNEEEQEIQDVDAIPHCDGVSVQMKHFNFLMQIF